MLVAPGCRAEKVAGRSLWLSSRFCCSSSSTWAQNSPAVCRSSYQQSIDRYYSLRGRNLVFVDVDATWQSSGRRARQRFEILNADGPTLILRDTFTGKVFTAGRGADDNLYLNWINVLPASAAVVKPVEVQLEDQVLAGALTHHLRDAGPNLACSTFSSRAKSLWLTRKVTFTLGLRRGL